MTTPAPSPTPTLDVEQVTTEIDEVESRVSELGTQIGQLDESLGEISDALTQTDLVAALSAGAEWGAVLLTLLLAYFAWKAWRTASSQVDDQIWGRQIEALSRYLGALHEFLDASPLKPGEQKLRAVTEQEFLAKREAVARKLENHTRIERDLQSTGAIWRMLHKDETAATKTLKEAEDAIVLAFGTIAEGGCTQENWEKALAAYIGSLEQWQVIDEDKQQEAAAILGHVEWQLGTASDDADGQ